MRDDGQREAKTPAARTAVPASLQASLRLSTSPYEREAQLQRARSRNESSKEVLAMSRSTIHTTLQVGLYFVRISSREKNPQERRLASVGSLPASVACLRLLEVEMPRAQCQVAALRSLRGVGGLLAGWLGGWWVSAGRWALAGWVAGLVAGWWVAAGRLGGWMLDVGWLGCWVAG